MRRCSTSEPRERYHRVRECHANGCREERRLPVSELCVDALREDVSETRSHRLGGTHWLGVFRDDCRFRPDLPERSVELLLGINIDDVRPGVATKVETIAVAKAHAAHDVCAVPPHLATEHISLSFC